MPMKNPIKAKNKSYQVILFLLLFFIGEDIKTIAKEQPRTNPRACCVKIVIPI